MVRVAPPATLFSIVPPPERPATVELPIARTPAPLTARAVVVPPWRPPTVSRLPLTVIDREAPLRVTAPVPISRSFVPVNVKSSFQVCEVTPVRAIGAPLELFRILPLPVAIVIVPLPNALVLSTLSVPPLKIVPPVLLLEPESVSVPLFSVVAPLYERLAL